MKTISKPVAFFAFTGVIALLCAVAPARSQVRAMSDFNDIPACKPMNCPHPSSCINNHDGAGLDGWFFDLPEFFTFWATDGSPTPACEDGYLRFIDPSPGNEGIIFCDAFVHPPDPQTPPPLCQEDFLGDWRDLDGVGRLCFDFRVFQNDTGRPCPPHCPRPNTVTIEGAGLSFTWESDCPSGPGNCCRPDTQFPGCDTYQDLAATSTPWFPVEVPIERSQWGVTQIDAGVKVRYELSDPRFMPILEEADWLALLADIDRVEIRMEVHENPAINDERTGLDNVILGRLLPGCQLPECPDPDPRTQGYWHRQCLGLPEPVGLDPGRNGRGPGSPTEPGFEDELIPCAEQRLTDLGFSGLSTCEGLDADPPSDKCEKAEKQLTALILNVCSGKLTDQCLVNLESEGCTSATVGGLIQELADLIHFGDCTQASDCAAAVNEGNALTE